MRLRWIVLIAFVLTIALHGYAQTQPTHIVKIDFNQRVQMRDGVELSADVYRPDAAGQFPVILSRTPYVKTSNSTLAIARYFVPRGYVFVAMDVRGRGDSDGEFVPYRNDGRDGYDTIEWCAKQAWSTGKIGTIGGSYNGRIQWLTALEQPPHLATMIAMVTPSDPFVEWPTGLPLPMDISWHHFTAGRVAQNMDAIDWPKIHRHLPLSTMDEAAGRPSSHWKEMFEHTQLDAWWEPLRYQNKFDRVKVPVLHISGWYDDEQVGTPLNFIGMTMKGATPELRRSQKLLMGPWPHAVNSTSRLGEVDFGPTAVIDLNGYCLRWFDYWLKGIDNGIMREPSARIFVMGENRWVDENEWPIARTQWVKYYLHSRGRANSLFGDGALSTSLPEGNSPGPESSRSESPRSESPRSESFDGFTNDPSRPVPFITEPSFAQIGSTDDYRAVERRDDVLVYTSAPVTDDVQICGPITARLYAASSARDTDFMMKLLDVWPNGYAQRLTDGMVRARFREGMEHPQLIEPGRVYSYSIDLWNTCQTFKQGHSIRVEVASTAFPKYDRNPNTGEPLGTTKRLEVAQQKVYHDRERASYILLPVVPRRP